MTIDTLTLKRDEDYFSLKYAYRLQNNFSNLEDQFIIADKRFSVSLLQRLIYKISTNSHS
ncbi:unnamed protein product [Debaryomyces fabryi]|nr:unnamed protein product [Debaryomyces fabryi]